MTIDAKPSVLVVEDENVVALDLSSSLEKLGFPVVAITARGEDAVELAARHRPGLVLMDIQLRGRMDGVEAAHQIKKTLDVPVVFLTAHSDEATLARARVSQPFGYILKPFEDRELEIAVQIAVYRHGLEAALRASERRLDAILSGIGDAVVAGDGEGRVTFVNPAAESLLGVRAADARGRLVSDLVQPSVGADGLCWIRRGTGSVPVEIATTPADAAAGPEAGAVTVLRDVSERLAAQAERQRIIAEQAARAASERRQRRLKVFDEVAVVLAEKFPDAPAARARAIEALVGPELRGRCVVELAEGGTKADNAAHVSPHAMNVPLRARSGNFGRLAVFRSVTDVPFDDDDRRFLDDLAMRCSLLLDNGILYQRAKEAVKVRDEFLSVASHELKTPLTPLMLQMHTLVKRMPDVVLDEKARAWLGPRFEKVQRQTDRLNRLVNELLDVSRIMGGRLHLQVEPVDFVEVVRDVTSEVVDERMGPGLSLVLPPMLVGRWDRLRLEQVVSNLVSNAVRYGGGKPIVVSASTTNNGEMILQVKDHGIGIAPADQVRIFERFERAVSVRNYGGLGLGLFITREVLRVMGGTIEVRSALGEGSTFIVTLPLHTAPAGDEVGDEDGDEGERPREESQP